MHGKELLEPAPLHKYIRSYGTSGYGEVLAMLLILDKNGNSQIESRTYYEK